MSGQPPGYNPGESLLQGGNASITPMQGGGTTNPEVSLLQGGNSANIIPLQGGRRTLRARPKGANTTPKQRIQYPTVATIVFSLPPEVSKALGKKKKGGPKKKIQDGGAATPITPEMKELPEAPPLADITAELPALREVYSVKMMSNWMRRGNAIETGKFITLDKYTVPKVIPNNQKGEGGFDRLAIVLDESIGTIVVFPAVGGNPETLARCFKFATSRNYEKDATVVLIFAPGFFGKDPKVNINLLANFIKFKNNAVASVYLLSENTVANRVAGIAMQAPDDPRVGVPLLNMLEPTYVIYPFAKMFKGVMKGGIIFSGAAADEVDLPASNIRGVVGVSQYIKAGQRGPIAFPPDPNKNDNPSATIPYEIYRFMGPNTLSILPKQTFRIILKSDDTDTDLHIINKNIFLPTDDSRLFLDGVRNATVTLNGKLFSIRKPGEFENVMKDWDNLKFTEDEADMLNELNLRPEFLPKIFGEDWTEELADFLDNVVNSNCFKDQDLLTSSECSHASEFVNAVAEYLFSHAAGVEYDRMKDDEAEDAAAKGMVESAFRSRETAEEAAKAAAVKQKAMIERLIGLMKAMGQDPNVSPDALTKNPFDENAIKDANKEPTELNNDIFSDTREVNKWSTEIFVLERRTDELSIAKITVDAGDKNAAKPKIDEAFKSLVKTYPGWAFSRGEVASSDEPVGQPSS